MSKPTVGVTGASGKLGHLVIEALLDRGVPADSIVAAVRKPEKMADLASRGIQVRRTDYTQPDTLEAAFTGVDRLLLISSSEVGQRAAQHGNVVKAARNAGVSLVAYTSILKADTSGMMLAAEHKATEEILASSGMSFVILRNTWYIENYTDALAQTLERGAVVGCASDGRVSAATRADLAFAAAAIMAGTAHENKVYELGSDQAFTMTELAAEISRQSSRDVVYHDLSFDAYVQLLIGAGLPEPFARILADSDLGIKRGDLFTNSSDLRRLINRPTTPLADAIATALQK